MSDLQENLWSTRTEKRKAQTRHTISRKEFQTRKGHRDLMQRATHETSVDSIVPLPVQRERCARISKAHDEEHHRFNLKAVLREKKRSSVTEPHEKSERWRTSSYSAKME
ncbi:hypothetical protein PR001_g3446 [Phytophthora rubi]|uniref:Uncharacterized protein n=1 Tax=Phytophthora rubi TaxID=129364 RepID=A0A6A3P5X5_9STRA|nr:hypothetical protein PR001_g3446 [Phytophthora rubi]